MSYPNFSCETFQFTTDIRVIQMLPNYVFKILSIITCIV